MMLKYFGVMEKCGIRKLPNGIMIMKSRIFVKLMAASKKSRILSFQVMCKDAEKKAQLVFV